MIGASKILTVSYGTFSCTLEGFDEPFNTMKAIAEYFRDLAADDRYFGAEPPTPDAAMLHRIAEREIQRRVEAKIQDNGVILRAADLAAPAPQPEPPVRPAPAPQPTGLLAEESVAAKLQRIRAAVSRAAQPAAAPVVPVVEDAVFVEDEHADDAAPVAAEFTAPAAVALAPYDDEGDFALVAPEDEPAAPAWEDRTTAEDIQPEAEAASTPDQDLPEVVADASVEEDDALIASLTAEAFVADEAKAMAALDAAAEDEDMSDLQALDGQPQWEAEPEYETEPAADADEWPQEIAAALDSPVQIDGDTFEYLEDAEAPAADLEAEVEAPAAVADTSGDWPADPEAEEPEAVEPVATPAAEKLRRARARVIKVRRPDADAAEAPAVVAPATPLLSPEEEAELQRELDAVEQDAESGRQSEREGRTILEASTTGDEAVNRLLLQTNTEMDGPENRRRMSTLAHLKAAVAATVADLRSPGAHSESGETSRLDRYRADLARVVRPRRPGAAADTDRPAPLVLVSEQRIDAQKTPPATDSNTARILPRRVTSGNLALNPEVEDTDTQPEEENIFVSSKSFAEFAERLGATELPDLLEAAAAYTACIEGRPHFSRPHLLRYVSELKEDSETAREDGLRSFGQLLRQGKIEKVKRGQFAITDSSYYLAEARRMVR